MAKLLSIRKTEIVRNNLGRDYGVEYVMRVLRGTVLASGWHPTTKSVWRRIQGRN